MIEDEMKVLLPKMSKSDIAKLQSEVIFQILSKSEIDELRKSVAEKSEEK